MKELHIKDKSDIIIPFDKIGDDNWKENTLRILTQRAIDWEGELEVPKTLGEIEVVEQRLYTTFPKGLKELYLTFGVAKIGEQLLEFEEIGYLQDIWKGYEEYGPDFSKSDKELLPYLITFSNYTGSGNMFCFHKNTKEIYYYDHDTAPYIVKLFDTSDAYIKACLINYQAEFFCFPETREEKVAEWCEDILIEIHGLSLVRKWLY